MCGVAVGNASRGRIASQPGRASPCERRSDLCCVKVPGGLSTHSQNRADAAESLALLSFLLHIIAQRFSALLAVMWTRCGRETSATIGHLPVDGGSNTLRRLSRASRTSRSNQVSRSGQRQDRDTRPYPRPTNLFTMRTPPSNLSLASQLRTRTDTEPPNRLIVERSASDGIIAAPRSPRAWRALSVLHALGFGTSVQREPDGSPATLKSSRKPGNQDPTQKIHHHTGQLRDRNAMWPPRRAATFDPFAR